MGLHSMRKSRAAVERQHLVLAHRCESLDGIMFAPSDCGSNSKMLLGVISITAIVCDAEHAQVRSMEIFTCACSIRSSCMCGSGLPSAPYSETRHPDPCSPAPQLLLAAHSCWAWWKPHANTTRKATTHDDARCACIQMMSSNLLLWSAERSRVPAADVGPRAMGAADRTEWGPVALEAPDVEVDGPALHAERVEPLLRRHD